MGKSVSYTVLKRDGRERRFEDVWATLFRELLWGPEAYEEWISHGEEIDWEPEDLSSIAIIDFDTKTLAWGEIEGLELPRARASHAKMLQEAWQGFTIIFLPEREMYAAAHVQTSNHEDQDEDDERWSDRPETVRDACGLYDSEDDDPEDEQEEDEYNDDDHRAWVTLVDRKGKIRQRNLSLVSSDLLSASKTAIQALANAKPAEVPPEKSVTEGLWIDMKTNEVGFWGGISAAKDFPRLQSGWPKWRVRWAENGYAEQCHLSDHPGIPMTDSEALAEFLPTVLSTKRMDFTAIIGAFGGELKKTALKAIGCLIFALAIPILITGFFLGKLKESGYAVLALFVLTTIAYKFTESRLKRRFNDASINKNEDQHLDRPDVAGPLDEKERRSQIEALLAACGYPQLKTIEPHFSEDEMLEN